MRDGPPASDDHLLISGGEISEGSRLTSPAERRLVRSARALSGAGPGAGRLGRYSWIDWGARGGRGGAEQPRGAEAGRPSGPGRLAPSSRSCRIVPMADGEGRRPAPGGAHRSRRRGGRGGGRGKESGRDGRRRSIPEGEEERRGKKRREPSSPSDDPLIPQRRLHLAEIGLYPRKPQVDVAL